MKNNARMKNKCLPKSLWNEVNRIWPTVCAITCVFIILIENWLEILIHLVFFLSPSLVCVCCELIETHKLQLNTAKWRKKAVQIFRVDKFSSFRCLGKVVAVVYKPVISPPKLHSRSPSNWSRDRGYALARDEKGCTIVLNGYVNK